MVSCHNQLGEWSLYSNGVPVLSGVRRRATLWPAKELTNLGGYACTRVYVLCPRIRGCLCMGAQLLCRHDLSIVVKLMHIYASIQEKDSLFAIQSTPCNLTPSLQCTRPCVLVSVISLIGVAISY